MKTKEELAIEFCKEKDWQITGYPLLSCDAFIAGYESAEKRISELESSLRSIINLSDSASTMPKDEFLSEWDKRMDEARELIKTK